MTPPRAEHRKGSDRGRSDDRHLSGANPAGVTRKLRCAVYTRKSSEEGLDMEFNSLDAQREACEPISRALIRPPCQRLTGSSRGSI